MSFGRDCESALLRAARALLDLRGVFHFRANNAGVLRTDRRTGRTFYTFAGLRGMSDILAVIPPHGTLLAIETKSPGGRLTPEQVVFLDNVRAAGGVGCVIRDLGELEGLLNDLLSGDS